MATKTYSNRGNCIRAARTALGKTAKPGTDFEVTKDGNVYSWRSLKARKRAQAAKGERAPVSGQPMAIKLMKYISGSAKGRSVADCQAHLGDVASHTVRGLISRLRAEGQPINTGRQFRNVLYTMAA